MGQRPWSDEAQEMIQPVVLTKKRIDLDDAVQLKGPFKKGAY